MESFTCIQWDRWDFKPISFLCQDLLAHYLIRWNATNFLKTIAIGILDKISWFPGMANDGNMITYSLSNLFTDLAYSTLSISQSLWLISALARCQYICHIGLLVQCGQTLIFSFKPSIDFLLLNQLPLNLLQPQVAFPAVFHCRLHFFPRGHNFFHRRYMISLA